MAKLQVEITADGARRSFVAEGDGPAIVAAFRFWLAGPDGVFPMADGADALDAAAAQRPAPQLPAPVVKHGVAVTRVTDPRP